MEAFANTLTNLDINLADACNLRCLACPCWLVPKPPRVKPAVLIERLHDVFAYLEANCPSFQKVLIIGGEPFVHRGLRDFLIEQRYSIYITVYTNLAIPLEETDWPDNVHLITSLDAADAETYSKIRGADLFDVTQENMRRLGSRIVHVDTTVSKANLNQLLEIRKITKPIGCTHWFLPIDPRMLRYAGNPSSDDGQYVHPRHDVVQATRAKLEQILLNINDLSEIRDFFGELEDGRSNDFDMFKGIYLSGLNHFQDLGEYSAQSKAALPRYVEKHACPGIRKYMEITFDADGKMLPVVHCPELRGILGMSDVSHLDTFPAVGPAFERFLSLFEWEAEQRLRTECQTFCGRTQFLGVDEYMEIFSEVT
jgi:MoaA/NifB/PqqE/SkfB family radical SAM enzyme